jgi:hypothetical protein
MQRGRRRWDDLEALGPFRRLSKTQQQIIHRIDGLLDQAKDSVVITDPLSTDSPIVYVTDCWETMCGYSMEEAVGRNPRLTQGSGTSSEAISDMKIAIRQQRACKIRVVNYRGGCSSPFWNCLTVHPVFHGGKVQLFIASLQDYSHRMTKLVSVAPAQFCAHGSHFQRRVGLLRMEDANHAKAFGRPCWIDASEDVGEDEGRDQSPPHPRPIKRLGMHGLVLEPEYVVDRLRDELQQMHLPCLASEMVDSGTELVRIKTFYQTKIHEDEDDVPDAGGVHVWIHVTPEDLQGTYSISLTRIAGDTFQYHKLFRELRARLSDLTASFDSMTVS